MVGNPNRPKNAMRTFLLPIVLFAFGFIELAHGEEYTPEIPTPLLGDIELDVGSKLVIAKPESGSIQLTVGGVSKELSPGELVSSSATSVDGDHTLLLISRPKALACRIRR